jgi:hypothetical protein
MCLHFALEFAYVSCICPCTVLCSRVCVFHLLFFLEGALLGCQCSEHQICLRNTENTYQRAWFDFNDAETEPIGKSSSNGLLVRVR